MLPEQSGCWVTDNDTVIPAGYDVDMHFMHTIIVHPA